MSNDRAIEVTETEPPISDAPWPEHGQPLDPNANTGPLPPLPEEPPVADEQSTERPRRWRWVPRSLSSRLVAFVVGLVLVVVTATGVATYAALHSFLLDRLDQQLNDTASVGSINDLIGAPSGSGTGLHNPQTVWVAFINPAGNMVNEQPFGA